jgi:hypothetical protein
MNTPEPERLRPRAAQAAILLRCEVDEIVVDEFSIQVTPSAKRSRSAPDTPVGQPKFTMRATIERPITNGEYVGLGYPLLGVPKRTLALASASVREEYRREYDADGRGSSRTPWPHPDEIDRLAQEVADAIDGILG